MKSLIWILALLSTLSLYSQDYLTVFSGLKSAQISMQMEEFDALQIQIIGSSGTPFIVALDSLGAKAPPVFWAMGDQLRAVHGGEAIVEIVYRICYREDCAVRYNLSTEKGSYVEGEVYVEYDTIRPNSAYIAINQLAGVFTLHQLLNIMDKTNIDFSSSVGGRLLTCYKPRMYNKADIACILSELISLPETVRVAFLQRISG